MAIAHALDPPHESFHIRREAIADCELHLDVVSEMLNLFSAAGLTNYAKIALCMCKR